MHILITGAAGMIGRKLTARLVEAGELNGQPIDELTLIDVERAAKTAKICRNASIPSPPTSPIRRRRARPSQTGRT